MTVQPALAAVIRRSSLDEPGFSVEIPRPLTSAQRFWFHGCVPERQLMAAAVATAEPKRARKVKFLSCGSVTFVEVNRVTGAHRVVANACESRACPRCGRKQQAESSDRLALWLGNPKPKQFRMITLTMKSTDAPLKQQLSALRASFRRLRQTTLWKTTQSFGKAVIEITYNHERRQWHPHLHVLSRGKFISQMNLADTWSMCSKGSRICDVRAVKNGKHCARYMAKHLGKPPDFYDAPNALALAVEWYKAIRNAKMLLSFGDAPPLPELEKAEGPEADPNLWHTLGTLEDILAAQERGEQWAKEIIEAILKGHTTAGPPSTIDEENI